MSDPPDTDEKEAKEASPPEAVLGMSPLPPSRPGSVELHHQQAHPAAFSTAAINMSVGGSPELAALQRLPADHLAKIFGNAHDLEVKKLDLNDKHLERMSKSEETKLRRDHDMEVVRRERATRFATALFLSIAVMTLYLLLTGKEDLALKVVALAFTHGAALVGGIGYEKWREASKKRDMPAG